MNKTHYFQISNLKAFAIIFNHCLKIFRANMATLLNSLAFYLLTITVFHIAIGPYELNTLTSFGIIIISLVFSLFLSANLLIKDDFNKGILEQWLIQPFMMEVVLIAKAICFILTFYSAFLLLLPISFLLYDLSYEYLLVTLTASFFTMIIITVILLFGEALTLHSNSSALSFVLVMPLMIPVLIAATLSVQHPIYLWLLLSLSLISITIFTLGTKYILKIQTS